jgi:hypothetical protein
MIKDFDYGVRVYLTEKQIINKDYDLVDEAKSEVENDGLTWQGVTETIVEMAEVPENKVFSLNQFIITSDFANKYVSVKTDTAHFNHEEHMDNMIAMDMVVTINMVQLMQDFANASK